MRLGVLVLGGAPLGVLDTEVLAALRDAEIDVIVPEEETPPVTTAAQAAEASQRLHRADCDGILLFVGRDDREDAVDSAAVCATRAALFVAGTPLLLSGLPAAAFFEVAGALEAIGVPFDRHFCTRDFELAALSDVLATWLGIHRREHRQRGSEAARALYGQRLHIPAPHPTPDVAAWVHQFGVVVVRDPADADFAADDGDALAALTAHLLGKIAGAEATVRRSPVWGQRHGGGSSADAPATFARIVTRGGRYRCVITRGEMGGDLPEGRASVRRYFCGDDRLFAMATFAEFCGVVGDHVGALNAACYALDIEPLILH